MIKAATALGIIMASLAASFIAIGLVSKSMTNTKGVMGTMTVALIEMAGVMAAISTLVIAISAIEKNLILKHHSILFKEYLRCFWPYQQLWLYSV